MLEQLNKQYSAVTVVKVDVRQHNQYASSQGVHSIPDTRIYYNQRKVGSFLGFRTKSKVESMIQPYLKRAMVSKSPPIVEAFTGKLRKTMNQHEDELQQAVEHNHISHSGDEKLTKHTPQSQSDNNTPSEAKKVLQPSIKKMEKDWLPPGVQRISQTPKKNN